MSNREEPIVVLSSRVSRDELRRLCALYFEDMVKLVADIERGVVALGGELHADAEAILLEDGSRQTDLWGANYYPGRGVDECVEFTSLINIRPGQGNRSMEIENAEIRARVATLTHRLVGDGEPL